MKTTSTIERLITADNYRLKTTSEKSVGAKMSLSQAIASLSVGMSWIVNTEKRYCGSWGGLAYSCPASRRIRAVEEYKNRVEIVILLSTHYDNISEIVPLLSENFLAGTFNALSIVR